MKRTIAVPLLTLLIGAGSASAKPLQDRVSTEVAKEQYLRTLERANDAFQKLSKADQDGHETPPKELREKIRPLVEESFEARQRLQRAELDDLRRRLADIEQAIENRERNRDAIIKARIEDVLKKKTLRPDAETRPGNDPNAAEKERAPNFSAEDVRLTPREQRDSPDLDLDTRQRLAELDLQAAEEDYQAAEKELSQARKAYESAAAPARTLRTSEKDHRHAAVELKRAHIKLEGLRSQWVEVAGKADAAVDAAMGEERETMARLQASVAKVETARTQVLAAEADVAKANAAYELRGKQYQRLQKLFEEQAVDQKALDEAAEQRGTSEAALEVAKAALTVTLANVKQSEKAADEIVAQLKNAEARVHAAKVERDRLGRRGQGQSAPATENKVPGSSSD